MSSGTGAALAQLDDLTGADGWVYASSTSLERDDPGRFHALFGRDSLLIALQTLTARPQIAVRTLQALADVQGRVEDPPTEEQPGRIVHEYRPVAPTWLVEQGWPVRDGGIRYYGSSDATSWFLVVLDAVASSGVEPGVTERLADARRAAGAWLVRALAQGGGLVRCGPRRHPGGLSQQGWRDSLDPGADEHGGGIVDLDGSMPAPPLADADSQAVAIAALEALVRLDHDEAARWAAHAAALRHRLRERFGGEVLALDGRDEPVVGAGSHLGWMLWAGVYDEAQTAAAVTRLTAGDVLTDYGVRTLSSEHPAFGVHGYHRGAIWPFDNWIAWGGLRRAGATAAAERVRAGVCEALNRLGRYPELYGVQPDGELEAIPVANRVQGWTVGAVVGFEADWDGLSVHRRG